MGKEGRREKGRAGEGRGGEGRGREDRAGEAREGKDRGGNGREDRGEQRRAEKGRVGEGRGRESRGGQGREERAGQGRYKQEKGFHHINPDSSFRTQQSRRCIPRRDLREVTSPLGAAAPPGKWGHWGPHLVGVLDLRSTEQTEDDALHTAQLKGGQRAPGSGTGSRSGDRGAAPGRQPWAAPLLPTSRHECGSAPAHSLLCLRVWPPALDPTLVPQSCGRGPEAA